MIALLSEEEDEGHKTIIKNTAENNKKGFGFQSTKMEGDISFLW